MAPGSSFVRFGPCALMFALVCGGATGGCRSGEAPVTVEADAGADGGDIPEQNACHAPPPAPPIEKEPNADEGFVPAGFDPSRPLVQAETPPPPVMGGTLGILADGVTAVAADPDRDRVYIVDLAAGRVSADIALQPGDVPGRHAHDGSNRVFLVLRGGEGVVTLDAKAGQILERRRVCPEPRGIALDAAAGGRLVVACAGGEVMTLPPAGGVVTKLAQLPADLRDVVVEGNRLLISRFRAAELIVLRQDGQIEAQMTPPTRTANFLKGEERVPTSLMKSPAVAWRLLPHPAGGALMLHQRGADGPLDVGPGGYLVDTCQGMPVEPGLTHFRPAALEGERITAVRPFSLLALVVDVAVAADASRVAVVSAATPADQVFPASVVVFSGDELKTGMAEGCIYPPSVTATAKPQVPPVVAPGPDGKLPAPAGLFQTAAGELVAVAFTPDGNVLVQSREPAHLEFVTQPSAPILLSSETRRDTGHELFHRTTPGVIACASCHPEGGEDGRVWTFTRIGKRRTQPLRGGIADTAPFHWDGDLRTLPKLAEEVFTGRMGGHRMTESQVNAFVRWIASIPNLKMGPAPDPAAVERGRLLFFSKETGCGVCHGGSDYTNHLNTDVGTGGCYQVPQLHSLAFRAPYMHDGCAPTLRQRFDPACGGADRHGTTSTLTERQLEDLIAFLETL